MHLLPTVPTGGTHTDSPLYGPQKGTGGIRCCTPSSHTHTLLSLTDWACGQYQEGKIKVVAAMVSGGREPAMPEICLYCSNAADNRTRSRQM